MVLCTPAYAQRIAEEPVIRDVIDHFGKTKNDSLHTFLCAGGFGDTALKVVDGHYLIRSYQGALKLEASLTSLQTFVDVILNVSGNQGLGFLVDLLDLEKMERAKARSAYGALFSELSNTLQDLTNQYRLTQEVELKTAQNPLRDYARVDNSLSPILTKTLTKPEVKTGLFLCPTKGDTLLTGLHLEEQLLSEGKLLLSIDCQDYAPQKLAGQSVRLALQSLGFKRPDIEALKRQPLVILFKNYEQLGAYDNLYVKNQLRQWHYVKVVVTCRADFFQHRDYQSCFLSDPANPQMDSLLVHTMPHFAPQEAEAIALSSLSQSQIADTLQDEAALSSKTQAIQTEVSLFLQTLYKILVAEGTLNPVLSQNPQAFISYAWEGDKTALARQQKHLARISRDLSTLGIPTWLDIERMTGDIDEQMAGNIKDSTYAFVIGTPRYTERAGQDTNVKKEYLAIVAKEKQGDLKVFPLQFLGDNAFPSDFIHHPNGLDFRQIDDEAVYTQQLTALIPKLVNIDEAVYQEQLSNLHKALELLPATHLITNKNQDEIQSYDIDNRLKAYVEPNALSRPEDPLDSRYDLPKHFNDFLSKDTKTYVTFGRAGSGKSLFTLYTFKELLQPWHEWRASDTVLPEKASMDTTRHAGSKPESSVQDEKPSHPYELDPSVQAGMTTPEWLPIYVPLKNYANEKAKDAIHSTLKDSYQLDENDIQALKQGLGINQKVLFILDGYDELGKGVKPNYAEQLKDWPHAKLLISSRPEHFEKDSEHLQAFGLNQSYQSYKAIYVSPFSPEDIQTYINAFDPNPETYSKIESIPGLMPLLDNPFLLNLVLQALPRLLETHQHKAVKRCDIYSAFIDTTFKKEAYKQQERGQSVDLTHYQTFAEELAFALFAQKTITIAEAIPAVWKLFTQADSYLREACPLKRTGEQYNFLHKSVYEYFVAVRLWNALKETSSEYWNTRPLTEERAVIDFLVEFYQTDYPFRLSSSSEKAIYLQAKERLFSLIERSKTETTVAQASANAMTVLNSANVPFFGKDFSHIRIPGADLSYSICDHTNFKNADLTNVQFQFASLGNGNLQGAHMQGVSFGELPYLPLKNSSNSCCYSKDGRLLAVATGNSIQIYNTYTRILLHTLEGHTDSVCSVSFSPSGDRLASGSSDQTIRLWDVERGELQKTLAGHTDSVRSVSFSPTGDRLASGSYDQTIRLWSGNSCVTNLNTFSAICTLSWKQSLTNEEAYLATGHADASVRYWRVTQLQNTPCFELLWSTKKPTKLLLQDANIEGAQGLSLLNAQLLAQRGAKGKPNMIQSLTTAAEQGDSNAQAELGKLYLEGKKTKKDLKKAIALFSQAAKQDNPLAAFYLGKCYESGEGVAKNKQIARDWYIMAAKLGSQEAKEELNTFGQKFQFLLDTGQWKGAESEKSFDSAMSEKLKKLVSEPELLTQEKAQEKSVLDMFKGLFRQTGHVTPDEVSASALSQPPLFQYTARSASNVRADTEKNMPNASNQTSATSTGHLSTKVGFFAQSQRSPGDTAKNEAENVKAELVQP
jgi:uncharacterized protein YjbI with pentapeptide repeats